MIDNSHLLVVLPLGYLLLQIVALRQMRDGWRVAAVLPALSLAGALLMFVVGIALGADFAAIWLILGLPAATLYLLVVLPLYWTVTRLRGI